MCIRSDPAAAPDNENLGLDAGSFLTQNNILAKQFFYFFIVFLLKMFANNGHVGKGRPNSEGSSLIIFIKP